MPRVRRLAVSLLVLSLALPAQAGTGQLTRFRLIIDQSRQTWRYPDTGNRNDTRLTRARAVWDEDLGPRLGGTLELTYLDLSQSSPGSYAATVSTGQGLGVGLHYRLIQSRSLGLTLFGSIGYQTTRGDNGTDTTERDWWQGQLGLQLGVPLGRAVTLIGGGAYERLGGEERITGNGLDLRRTFELDEPAYGFAGARLNLGSGGFLGLRYHAGSRSGGYVSFGNTF